jgi:hypothetical protein
MPDKVAFATSNKTNAPNKPAEFSQTEWDAYNSSKFNGFPFPTIEKAQDNQPFENWDRETTYQGVPSKSEDRLISVLGDNYSYKFTYEALFKLFWRLKGVKLKIGDWQDTESRSLRQLSYDTTGFTSGSSEKNNESELITDLDTNKWSLYLAGCEIGIDFTKPVLKLGEDDYRPYINCGCCGLDAVFQSLTASLPHHGFSARSCPGDTVNLDPPIKYLTLTYSGLATTGCGEYKKHGPAERSYVIDPKTGYQCIGGDPSPSFWCSPGTNEPEQCSETSKKWDCGPLPQSRIDQNCGEDKDEDGNLLRLTLEETMSNPYTIDDVESNVDSLLSENPITENSMPPGVAGTVVAGSGHSIITWSGAAAATSAYFYKAFGQVMKTKLRVTFPNGGLYKLVTKDESGEVVSEEEKQATKGQVITVPPPESPGYTTVEPVSCAFPSIPTTLDSDVSGNYTTKRKACRNEAGDEIPCPSCNYFIGPDCEQYNTKTVGVSGNSTRKATWYQIATPEHGGSGSPEVDDEVNGSVNLSSTYKETACPYSNECISKNNTYSYTERAYEYIDTCTCEIGCDNTQPPGLEFSEEGGACSPDGCGMWWGIYGSGPVSPICGIVACNKEESDSESINYPGGEDEFCMGGYTDTTESSSSQSISISGNVVTSTNSSEYSKEEVGRSCGGFDGTVTESKSANCTVTVTYSNEEGADGPTGGWETESLPWCSEEQTEGCVTFTGCVEKFSRATYSTESSATVSCEGSFTAPEAPEGETNQFETWFHYYTVEDSGSEGIELNLGRTGCRTRTVQAFNTRVNTSSEGGETSVSGPSISLSTSEGKTKCLIGPVAYTTYPS